MLDEIKSYFVRYAWRSMQPKDQERIPQAEQQRTQHVEVILTMRSDPLDFQEVPIKEAVTRVNDAGFFILANGEIYQIEPNGGIRKKGLTHTLAGRRAR